MHQAQAADVCEGEAMNQREGLEQVDSIDSVNVLYERIACGLLGAGIAVIIFGICLMAGKYWG